MKNCEYPNCQNCTKDDCDMGANDIQAMLKRRRWNMNPELHRQKQRDYRSKIRENLPHCNKCDKCVLVKKDKGDGFRRLCILEMRLIEQKVVNSPHWCELRRNEADKRCQNMEA